MIVRDPLMVGTLVQWLDYGALEAAIHWGRETIYGPDAFSDEQKQKRDAWKTEAGNMFIANKRFHLGT